MKIASTILAAAAIASASPALADPPLSGEMLVAGAPYQPFCATRRALAAYVLATIQHDLVPLPVRQECTLVIRGTPVTVTEDLGPYGRYMHMVRARAAFSFPFGKLDAYTYSAGLSGPYGANIPAFPMGGGLSP